VSSDLRVRKEFPELHQQQQQLLTLFLRARVGRVAFRIQTTLIANADGATVPGAAVRAHFLQLAVLGDDARAADVEMIARAIKSTSAVRGFQSLPGKGTVLARGAAMYHNQINFSHFFLLFAFGGCSLKGTTAVHGVCAECTQKCRSYSDDYFQNLVPG